MLPVHTKAASPLFRIPSRDSRYADSRCGLYPALMSTTPHYGLRYGAAPASGNFQRLRARPPLLNPLKSCMDRFNGGNMRVFRNELAELDPLILTTAYCQRGHVGFEADLDRRSRHHDSPRLVATALRKPRAGVLIPEEICSVTREANPYRPYRNQAEQGNQRSFCDYCSRCDRT
jgi:hypothetical protein